MKSAEIEVGKTYQLDRGGHSSPYIVEVLRVATQKERKEEIEKEGPSRFSWRNHGTDTVQVKRLATAGDSEVIVLKDESQVVSWIRPAAIVRPLTIEEARESAKKVRNYRANARAEAEAVVERVMSAIGDTGLPMPKVTTSYRSNIAIVEWPKWGKEDYDRLLGLLGSVAKAPPQ